MKSVSEALVDDLWERVLSAREAEQKVRLTAAEFKLLTDHYGFTPTENLTVFGWPAEVD